MLGFKTISCYSFQDLVMCPLLKVLMHDHWIYTADDLRAILEVFPYVTFHTCRCCSYETTRLIFYRPQKDSWLERGDSATTGVSDERATGDEHLWHRWTISPILYLSVFVLQKTFPSRFLRISYPSKHHLIEMRSFSALPCIACIAHIVPPHGFRLSPTR